MHIDVETTTTTTIPQNSEPQILEKIIETHVPEPQIPETLQQSLLPIIYTTDSIILNQNLENTLPLSPIHIETLSPNYPTINSEALIIHLQYQPLTMDEIIIALDLILPIHETLSRSSIDIERPTELIPRYELNKIQIKSLKRTKPSPKPLCLSTLFDVYLALLFYNLLLNIYSISSFLVYAYLFYLCVFVCFCSKS
jgi:hypothetical protein